MFNPNFPNITFRSILNVNIVEYNMVQNCGGHHCFGSTGLRGEVVVGPPLLYWTLCILTVACRLLTTTLRE